jgi:hypothetical protein
MGTLCEREGDFKTVYLMCRSDFSILSPNQTDQTNKTDWTDQVNQIPATRRGIGFRRPFVSIAFNTIVQVPHTASRFTEFVRVSLQLGQDPKLSIVEIYSGGKYESLRTDSQRGICQS